MRQVLDTLVEGKSIEHKVTLAEGLTSYQIVAKLMAHPELHGEITEIPPEGSLLPDTYRFGRNDSRQEIIRRQPAPPSSMGWVGGRPVSNHPISRRRSIARPLTILI